MDPKRINALLAEHLFGWRWATNSKGQRVLLDRWMDDAWAERHYKAAVNRLEGQTWATTWEGVGRVVQAMAEKG